MNDARMVGAHMNPVSQAVGPATTLGEAQLRMLEHGTQMLPVLDRGQPCGVLLERDLHMARQLGADFDSVTAGMLLPRAAFSVKPTESLASAVRSMASRATTHAVVIEGTELRGILTAHDALRVLAELLEGQEGEQTRQARASSVEPVRSARSTKDSTESATWVNDQSGCSLLDAAYLIERVEETAAQLMRDSDTDPTTLRNAVHELHDAQTTLLASERRELAETRPDEEPLHRTRLEQLSEERARHTQTLAALLLELEGGTKPVSTLAGHALQAAAALRAYIERERDPLRFVS